MKLLKVSTLGLLLGGMCVLNVCADEMSSQGSSWSMKIEQHGDMAPKFESESVQYKDGQIVDKKSAKGIIDENGNFVQTPEAPRAIPINTPSTVKVFVPEESDYEEEEQEDFDQNRFEPENRSVCPIKTTRECPIAKFRKHHRSDFRHPWKESEEFDEDFEEEDTDVDSCFAKLWRDFAREMSKLAERDELFFRGQKLPCFGDSEMREHRKKFPCPKKWKLRRHKMMPYHKSQYPDAPQFAPEERHFQQRLDAPHFVSEEKSEHYHAPQFAPERRAINQDDDDDFEFTHPSFRHR